MTFPTASLQDHAATLSRALSTWARRDDSRAEPEVRQAANVAMETIDAMLAALHQMRRDLGVQMNISDDAAIARADALLAEGGRDG